MKGHSVALSASIGAFTLLVGALVPIGWLYAVQPLINFIQVNPVHATAIPWLQTEAECRNTGRVWNEGQCWDNEHDPNF